MFYKDNHNREKQLRFSIRKVSFGAASVVVATLLMFLGNGAVEASEQQNSTNEAILEVTSPNRDESISTVSKTNEGSTEADKKNSVEQNNQPLAKSEKENRESVIPTDTPTTLNTETNQEKPAVLKRVRRSNPDSGMDSSTTNDDPSANKVFEAPAEGASLDELKAKLNELEDSVENNDKIRDMDTVGNSKQVEKGTVNEINKFGGWKAVTDNGETGKFAIARKTEGGVFPLETVNTVRTITRNQEYYYDTYVREQAFDRTGDYMLFLSKVRTLADRDEPTFDGQPYKEDREGNGIARGVKGFNGIEKTFKAYSSETGSTVKISFKTGYSGDINGGKAKYKVEVMIDENGVKKTIYTKIFSPTDNKNDGEAIITPARDGNKTEYLRNLYNDKILDKKQVEAKMAEEANKPNGTPGKFTSKNIVLPKGVTDYTVRISSADNQHLGMGYQSPHNHYALPISGLEFSISQDTSNLAKNLLQRIYNKLKETESTDKSQKTGDTASNYENKLNEIDALLKSSDLKTTAEYKRLSLDLLNAKEQLKEVTPDAPAVAVDSDKAQVTVTPSANADRLEVSVGNDKVVATKTGSTWSLATPKEGVSIDANTGVVTVAHNAADANTVISATAKHGNSDLSSAANGNLPAKEVTPDAPAVAVDSDKAQVTVTPSSTADRLEVSVGNDKLVATKTGSTWSLATPKEGVSIDANTGVVTVAHNAADANTVISATAKHGNSDLSAENSVQMPSIKPLALADIERISNESIADIDKVPDLKEYEKNVAKEKVRKELAVAKEAIKNARNNAGVESTIRNFVYKILGAVLPITDYDLNILLVKGTVQVYLGETLYEEKIKEKIVLEKDVQVSRIIYPDTHSLGQKFAKVTLKLPDNSTIEINVPVEVVAFQGGNSGVPSSMQQGQNNSKIPQKPQEQTRTSQIQQDNPQTSPQPSPGQELPPTRPVEISINEGGSKNQSFTTQVDRNKLPNTGSTDSTAMLIVGTASALLGIGLTGRRRKED